MTVSREFPDFAMGDAKGNGRARMVEQLTGWVIEPRHRNNGVMRQLETFIRMEQDLDVTAPRRESLLVWMQEMNGVGVVLDYHPDAPPNDACRTGGFFFRRREAGDHSFFRRHE